MDFVIISLLNILEMSSIFVYSLGGWSCAFKWYKYCLLIWYLGRLYVCQHVSYSSFNTCLYGPMCDLTYDIVEECKCPSYEHSISCVSYFRLNTYLCGPMCGLIGGCKYPSFEHSILCELDIRTAYNSTWSIQVVNQ